MENKNELSQIDALQRSILERATEIAQASIAINKSDRPQSVFRFEINVATARDILEPYVINFPFRSIFVETASDPSNKLNIKPTTNDEHQNYFSIGYKDSWSTDKIIPKAFLHWTAQTGTMTLVVFTDAEFRSGSQVSLTNGGVSITEGSSIVGPTRVTLAATTATIIAPQDFTRKKATIQNKTGADLYIGGSTIGAVGGATEGIKMPNDSIIYWQNSAALYAWSVLGGNVHRLDEA